VAFVEAGRGVSVLNSTFPSPADPLGEPALLNTLFDRMAGARALLTVYECGRERRLSFAEVYGDVARGLAFLRNDLRLPPRARVGIIAQNSYEWVVLDLACLAGGYVPVPLDPTSSHDFAAAISFFELAVAFTDRAAEIGRRSDVIAMDSLLKRSAAAPLFQSYRYARDDILAIKFTSGSTQLPKAMEAKVISAENSIRNVQRIFRHQRGDRVLVFLPLYLLQQRFWIYSAVLFDYDVVVTVPTLALTVLEREKPTVVMGVPAFFENIRQQFIRQANRGRVRRWTLALYRFANRASGGLLSRVGYPPFKARLGGSIRYLWTGSATSAAETLAFYQEMGVDLFQGYGMNETCIVSKNYAGCNRIGSVGRLLPNYRVTFDDDGQVLVHNACDVNKAYYKAPPEVTAQTFEPDGTVKTGDLGWMDAEGYLHITGRKKDLIVLNSGRKIEPQPIEARLRQSELIENCMVVGSERPYCTVIVHPAEQGIELAAIEREIAKVNAHLSPEERLMDFVLSKDGFTTDNGLLTSQYKLRRAKILEHYADAIARLY
jgi:long-chain acyl-CoA synthetase